LAWSIGDASTLGRGYGKRIDEMIAALETNGVPVLWIGLPAIRGTRTDWRHQLPQRALSEAKWQNRREFVGCKLTSQYKTGKMTPQFKRT
jgi:hypothetical protein